MKRRIIKILAISLALLFTYIPLGSLVVGNAAAGEIPVCVFEDFTAFGIAASAYSNSVRVVIRTSGGIDPDFSNAQGAERVLKGPDGYYILVFSERSDAESFAALQNDEPGIEYAQTESSFSLTDTGTYSASEVTHNSWGVSAIEADLYANYIVDRDFDGNVSVAVIDSGVASHSFLSGKVIQGHDYIDNDDDSSNDYQGHGTHVAGTVIDCTEGTDIKVLAVRVLDAFGSGDDIGIASGIRYAVDEGAKVLNLSISGEHTSEFLEDAISYASSMGCTVVAAAGNENADTQNVCPAHIAQIITVAAVDKYYKKASFSNYGGEIDIAAPGVDIKSTKPDGEYALRSGTSMAAPHISACAAMLWAAYPNSSPAQIDQLIKQSAIDLGAASFDEQYGYGFPKLSSLIPEDYSLASIEITSLPMVTEYYIGDTFNPEGLSVKANFRDGLSFEIKSYIIEDVSLDTEGTVSVIIEYTEDGVTVSTSFDVTVSEPYINLSSDYAQLYVGALKNIVVSVGPPDAQIRIIENSGGHTQSSLDSGILTIEGTAAGTDIITLEFDYHEIKYSDTITVSVSPMPVVANISIASQPTKNIYYIGDTLNTDGLEVNAVLYNGETVSLFNYSVSDVNMSTTGQKTVIVTYDEGTQTLTDRFNVMVYTPTVSITVSNLTPEVSETVVISVICAPDTGGSVELKNDISKDEYFSFSTQNGLLCATALREGEGDIIAVFTYNSIKYTNKITLNIVPYVPRLESITVTSLKSELSYGDSVTLNVEVVPLGINNTIVWSSSDPSVASVSDSGVVTAVGKGIVTITAVATDDNGISATGTVQITCKMTIWQLIIAFFRMLFESIMNI